MSLIFLGREFTVVLILPNRVSSLLAPFTGTLAVLDLRRTVHRYPAQHRLTRPLAVSLGLHTGKVVRGWRRKPLSVAS